MFNLFVFMLFSHLSLQCLYEMGLVYNDTFVLNVDCVYGEIEPSKQFKWSVCHLRR